MTMMEQTGRHSASHSGRPPISQISRLSLDLDNSVRFAHERFLTFSEGLDWERHWACDSPQGGECGEMAAPILAVQGP